jgi:hypothetical protein
MDEGVELHFLPGHLGLGGQGAEWLGWLDFPRFAGKEAKGEQAIQAVFHHRFVLKNGYRVKVRSVACFLKIYKIRLSIYGHYAFKAAQIMLCAFCSIFHKNQKNKDLCHWHGH